MNSLLTHPLLTQKIRALSGVAASLLLLSACGGGSGDASLTGAEPAVGQAKPEASEPIAAATPQEPATGSATSEPPQDQQANLNSATPTSVGCSAATNDMQASTLALLNQARSVARMCGNQSFAAAPPLKWSNALQSAAQRHSTDMARHNFFSHTGSDGSRSSQRATQEGYTWRTVGENIAAGQANSANAMQGWLESPGHCANIMNPSFEDTAVSCAEDGNTQYGEYWTNVFGASR